MNELGRTELPTTDHGRRFAASRRGVWRPVGAPASGRQYATGPDAGGQYAGGPQHGGPQHGGPQYGAPQYGGPQAAGPQYGGPQYGGPQYAGPQYAAPQYAGPQQAGPHHAGPQQAGPGAPGPHAAGPGHPHRSGSTGPHQRPPAPHQAQPAGFAGALPPRPPVTEPPAAPAAEAAPPRRRGRVGRWVAVGVIVAALGGVGWYVTVGAPAPVTAAVGDCVAQTGENDVKVVGCGDPAARFKVAGKVEDKTMIAASLFACSDFPTATSSFWQGEQDKPGTVLCLAPLHP